MFEWALIAALVLACLGSAFLVAEWLCRRDAARHGILWVENRPDDSHKLPIDQIS